MEGVSHQRCLNHPLREAVARCPNCASFYCRECVTEHEGRVLCAPCLRREVARATRPKRPLFVRLLRIFPAGLGLLTAWLFFYLLGRGLLLLPDDYPEGSDTPSASQAKP